METRTHPALVIDSILVATDFSAGAGIALNAGAEIAQRCGAVLTVGHASHIPDEPPAGIAGSPTLSDQWRLAIQGRNARVGRQLGELRRAASRRGVEARAATFTDYPDSALTRALADQGFDLLVLGARGEDGPQAGLGSVASRMVRTASSAVLVVRNHAKLNKVLVGTDFSPTSERTLHTAIEIAEPNADIRLVHVVNPSGLALDDWPDDDDSEAGSSSRAAHALVESAKRRGQATVDRYADRARLRFSLVEGRPSRALRRLLADGDFDLVAVGSHGHRGWRRFILGTVAESIARYAPCSVLVVPPKRGFAA